LRTTGPLTIVGNGATITGDQLYINSAGLLNDPTQCPSKTAGTNMIAPSTGFLEVGDYDVDNSAVTVSVSDLHFEGMPSLFLVEKSASLSLTGSKAEDTLALSDDCDRSPIESRSGSVSLTNVEFHNSSAPAVDRFGPLLVVAVVSGFGDGSLTMDHVLMDENFSGRAVVWHGSSAKIVSSQFYVSGGFWLDAAASYIVNSVVYIGTTHATDRIVSTVGPVHITASTLYFNEPYCQACDLPNLGLVTDSTGTFDLTTSALGSGADHPDAKPLLWGNTSTGFTSDSLTWVQPSGTQDATAIAAILPNALTAAPGLQASFAPGLLGGAIGDVTPLLGTLGSPGVLIDAVDPGDCPGTNGLLNPIDSTCITTDVFGNPRWDSGNNKRNVGAIQNVTTPHLTVATVGDTTVDLSWNKPTSPGSSAITGYWIFYRTTGSGPWMRGDVAGADTLTHTVTGLTNGTEYEFEMIAVYSGGSGPESNVVHATPFGPVTPPDVTGTPGSGSVKLSWTEPTLGGHSGPVSYYVTYRPVGSPAWIVGPGPITGRITTIPGLATGTEYEFAVFATAFDGTSSLAGTASVTPLGTLPATGSRPAMRIEFAVLFLAVGALTLGTTRRQRRHVHA
jgi:hypothetical protein